MFSGFDFKRFSLDALQDEENEEGKPATPMPIVPENVERPERAEAPPPQKIPPSGEEHSEWDWDHNTAAQMERRRAVSEVRQRRIEANTERANPEESVAIPTEGTSIGAACLAEAEKIDIQGNSDAGERRDAGQEVGADNLAAKQRRDVARVYQEANTAATSAVGEGFSNDVVRARLARSSLLLCLQVDGVDMAHKKTRVPDKSICLKSDACVWYRSRLSHNTRSQVVEFDTAQGRPLVTECKAALLGLGISLA